MFRFLPGVLIVQALTLSLVMIFPASNDWLIWLKLGIPLFIVAVLVAFWFNSIAGHISKNKMERLKTQFTKEQAQQKKKVAKEKSNNQAHIHHLKHQFAQERETYRVDAERAKTRIIKQTQQQITTENKRTHGKANFKVGAAVAGTIGMGAIMLLIEFFTMGLLLLTTTGGAAVGYFTRLKQEHSEKKLPDNNKQSPIAKIITGKIIKNKNKNRINRKK